MQSILLTGAGFSRNWGGWLATQAFEYLLGRSEMNPRIRNCLWKFGGNFENTFQELKAAAARTKQRNLLNLNFFCTANDQ